MLRQYAIALLSVKVVSVDHCEGPLDGVGGHQYCVHRAPWLGPAGWEGKSRRKFVEFLKYVFDRDAIFKPPFDGMLERLLHVLTDNEHDFAEPGADSIVDRIVHDGFTTRTDRLNLLEAAKTAAHAGCQDKQSCRCHRVH